MTARFHEIVEVGHRILNPFSSEKLRLIGEIAEVGPTTRQVDLCCGKAEMLAQYALQFGGRGVGVDRSAVFLEAGRRRLEELGVARAVALVQAEAAGWARACADRFDVVSCIGATWIGDGLAGTLDLMKPLARDASSRLLVGDVFWAFPPSAEARASLGPDDGGCTSLGGTLDRFEAAGLDLVEMVVAEPDEWDRYEASQWKAGLSWLEANPTDPDAAALRSWIAANRDAYLRHQRGSLGWGVFVLRPRSR